MEKKLKVLHVLLAIVIALGLSGAAMACPTSVQEIKYYSDETLTQLVGAERQLCCPCTICSRSWGEQTPYFEEIERSCGDR